MSAAAAAATANKENAGGNNGPGPRAFSPTELKSMLGQCLKMASENKITPQNTWQLQLIEHLPELIREEGGAQTNFQRASVTLDAGVKIYSYRVDSVHTETFKILGGLGRASGPADEPEPGELGDGGVGDGEEAHKRRRRTHELNPEATLEASLEALNVKKFDLAFAVDPLFHKTSAQFDEGGAKGLLLNNLSVFHGCDIVFDSMDVPEAALDACRNVDPGAMVNLGSLQQQLAALALGAAGGERISPTLDAILELLDEAPADDAAAAADAFVEQVAEAGGAGAAGALPWAAVQAEAGEGGEEAQGEAAMEGVVGEYAYAAAPDLADAPGMADDYDDDGGFGGDDYYDADSELAAGEEQEGQAAAEGGEDGAVDQPQQHHHAAHAEPLGQDEIQWLVEAGSNNMVTRAKGWAGGAHWKYRAVPQAVAEDGEEGGEEGGAKPKKRTTRRKNDPLDFVTLMEGQDAEVPQFDLLPSKRGKDGEGKAKKGRAKRGKAAAKTLLPEDHHYNVDNLNRFALRPRNAMPSTGGLPGADGTAGGAAPGGAAGAEDQQPDFQGDDAFDGFGGGAYDDDDDAGGDGYDGGWGDLGDMLLAGDGEGLEMVQAARKVEKVEVNYSRAAKQVDVRSLKELIWSGIHAVPQPGGAPPSPDSVLEFQDVLRTVPERNPAGRLEDLSVHLCFICMLHLANEHGLVIRSVPELSRLLISNVPQGQQQHQ
ncbi:condensin complex subunit 2 [Chlorella sorokiniana]|uniref:Condensin complex subunit 2 n=1 Tax=Chlorella sorokiniana TaxID=3076 RepID=A0A2P6TEW7_CHLSO|nr:condensin complex subunit 2 [Chlorella sorokiniana]|eukprot:PRW32517.1 condensin complex subunit 2 [Chlorella sorokiniana]